MTEWWSYRPSDFLMFAPRTYWRLFELHNAAWWPAALLFLLAALAWLVWLWRSGTPAWRAGAAGLAAAWLFVAIAFTWQRYAPINWAAMAFAAGQIALAFVLATLAKRNDLRMAAPGPRRQAAWLMWFWALIVQPLLAPGAGRPWAQAEVIALAPDTTALATLGLLLFAEAASTGATATRWWLRAAWALALAWCAISAATLLTMGAAQGWVTLIGGIAAVAATVATRRSP